MPRKLTADEIRELQERRKAARDKAAREGTYQPMYDPYALTNSEYYNEVMSEQQQQRQEAERIALERLQQEKLIEQQQEEQRRAEINEVGQMFVTEAKKKRAGSASNAYEQVAAAAEKIKAGKDKPSTEAAPQNLPTAAQAKPGSKNEWQSYLDAKESEKKELERRRDAVSLEMGKVYDGLKALGDKPDLVYNGLAGSDIYKVLEGDKNNAIYPNADIGEKLTGSGTPAPEFYSQLSQPKTVEDAPRTQLMKKGDQLKASYDLLTQQIEGTELEQYNIRQLSKHYAVMDEPDFAEYAAKGRAKDGNEVVYILSDDNRTGAGYEQASALTDAERNIYDYYYAKDGAKKADQFLKDIEPVLNERVAARQEASVKAASRKHPYLVGLPTAIAGQTASGATALGLAGQAVFNGDKPVDPNSPWTAPVRAANAAIEGATSDMGEAGKFLYQTGTSIGGSALNALMGPAGLANMAASAAGSNIYDNALKTDNKARMVWTGILNGIAEYAGEKLGGVGRLEGRIEDIGRALANNGGTATVLKYIAAHAGEEGLEEVGTEVMNKAVDMLVMGDEGELRTYYNQQLAAGEDAFKLTAGMALRDIALAGLGGAVSGGVMAGGPALGMGVRGAVARAGQTNIDYNRIRGESGVGLGENSRNAQQTASTADKNNAPEGEPTAGNGQDRSSYVERIQSLSRVFNDEVTNAFLDDFTEDELRRYVQTSTDELRRQAAEIAIEYREAQSQSGETEKVGEAKFDVRQDENGTFINIDKDILAGVPESEYRRTVREFLKKNFPSINVNGQKIIVNNASRGEFTNSKYGRMLESNEPDVYTDKMRMANNLDEIVQNQDNIQGSAAKHPRRDRIVQFDEGDVRIKVGNKMYTAKVQIGVWDDGTKVFYDILNIKDTGAVPSVSSFKTNNTGRNQPSVSDVSVSQNQAAVNTQNENSSTAEQQGTNPNLLTKEQREAVNRLARACGVKVEIVPTLPMKNGRGANGKYVKGERAIYLAEDADRPMFDIFSHEVTHYLRMVSPEAFSHYSRAVMETLVGENALEGENANETRARLVRQVREDYASAGQELGYADAMEELAADFTGRLIDSPEEAVRMINEAQSLNEQQKRNVIQRIIDAIDRFVKRIRAYIRNTGDNAAPEELTQLDRTRQALVELLAAGEQSTETVNKNGPDRYSFAGEGARTADRAALDRARQMERRGARPETIWEETGWGRGLDGKWRYEIDDSAMNYDAGGNINASDDMRRANELADKVTELSDEEYDELLRLLKETEDERNGRTLGDYLGHTKLFEAYPELNEVGVRMRRDLAPDEYGSYDPDTNTININASISARNQAATMVHEVQHAIQNREGFAEGASSEYWNARQSGAQWVQATERIQNEIDGLRALLEDDPNAEDADLIRGDIDELEDKLNSLAFELYQNTAGEIEAREAAIRRNMPAEERRRFFPESMRPNENAVFAEEGTSYSKNPSDSEVVSIKGQIQAHLDEINEMKPVAVLSYQQGQSTRQIRENVVRMFKQFGYKVDRQGFGIIDINEKQLNESLNYLQTEEEKAAIFTVPRVLKRGIMINERIDHKDRNYGTVTIAAPVTINGVDGVVGVVVKKVKGNRYKTHRILMPDGSAFTFSDNNKTEATTGKMASVSEGESLPITSVNNTVSQNGPAVNTQNENSEEKFSLKAPVEETKELVAVHNLSEDNLKGVLELGGFPMPSIAVTKASMGHSQFGDISVVFGKDTIDPQKNSGNRVYAGDAWTPTFPNVEYEASEEAQKRIRDKYYELYRKYGADAARPLYGYGNYLEDEMNRMGGVKGIFDREKDNTGMMRLFLMDSGKENPAPVTVSKTTRMSDGEIELYKLCIEKMGEETFNDMSARDGETPLEARRRWMNEHRNDLEGVLKEFFMNADVDEAQASTMAETQPPSYYVKMAIYARRYMRNGPEKTTVETDAAATAKALRDAVDKNEYETWLKKLFAGAQKRSGIRNGRAPYTAQGNRRSFGATHDEYNLDNIVRAMKREMEKGGSGALATPSALRGAATRELTSIEDIRRHKGQITEVSESEALGYRNDFSDRLGEICNKAQKDDRFITDFANVIIESLDGAKTWNTVEQRIRQYGDVYNINDALLTDIRELLSDMRKAPVRYFEAKPRRSVNFEEAVAIIAPDSMNEGLKEQVRQRNINLVEYPTGDEDARLRELNNLDDARFSLKRENGGNGDTHYKTRLGLERAVNRLERAQSEAARADTSEGTRLSLKKGDYDYTKPFAQQVDDWKQGLIPQNDSLVVGATPETFVKVGFNSLPMTINQTHVDYAVNGTRDKDHYIGEAMLKQLPQKLADPVAIITSQTQTGTSVVALLDFVHNGKTVIVPVTVDGHGRQNSLRIDSNAITSVFAKGNAITKLLSDAINGETSNKVGIYYLNAKKAPALLQGAGLQLPGGLFLNGGFIHSITDPGSPVKPKLKNVTQSQQFKRWFGDWEKTPHTASKVVNPDGTPKVVYHGTDAKFNVFDSTKGRSSMDIQGMFFSPWELDAQGYGENVGAYYLNIKNPAPEATAYRALNKFAGQNDAGIKAREYLERLGYDGVNNGDEEYIAFYPEQIKSATDNIGTFDPDNGDIRYSLKGGTDIFRADDAAANGYDGKTNGNGAQNEKNTLIEKINSAENVLADMDIVDTLTGAEFPKSEKGLVDQVTEFYSDAYNGKVTNPEIGEVRLSKQGVRSSIAHGLGRTKAITFAAVPSVIENGKIIEHTNNWKGRGYDTYIVAAPIEISEQRAIVGVVITSNKNSNDYYLHEVAIKDDVPFKTGRGNNALNSSDTSTSNINISQTASAVNTKNEKSEVWSQDRGLQLPKSADTITRSNSSILQKSDFVNTQNENTDDIRYSVKADMAKEGYDPEKLTVDEMIDWLINKYGKVKQGENPARDVSVPKKTAANRPVSLFARTMMEAGITPDWAVSEFEQAIIDGTLTHEVITDDSARQRAEDTIKDKGFEEALRDWQTHSYENNINKNSFALGITLYNGAITEASEAFARGDEVAGREATRTAMKLAAELTVEATAAGQTLQATRMLKRMSPDGQLYYVEKSVQRLNKEFKERLGDKFKGIELDEAMMEEFFRAKDEESRSKAYDKICQNIADQIPATVGDKWNAWRYLSMLFNTHTHFRNIVGNATFYPAVKIKNFIDRIIEPAAELAGGIKKEERTQTFKPVSREIKDFTKKDFKEMESVIQGVNAKYALTSDIDSKRRIFRTGVLEALRRFNNGALEAEDMMFLKLHYTQSLGKAITARGYTAEFLNSGTKEAAKALDSVRAYAVREAQRATYRDANALASALTVISRRAANSKKISVRAAGAMMEGVMPFKKTPLNIVKQGALYSPLGLFDTARQIKSVLKGGKVTGADVIDSLSRAVTGTGIIALGMWLRSLGMAAGPGDDDEKKDRLDETIGEQDYALKIGDGTYTVDWAAPVSLPFFVGVTLGDYIENGEFTFADMVNALTRISEPMFELSVLQGISDTIKAASYAKSDPLTSVAGQMAESYVTQALPTLGGQIARSYDATRRKNYVDKNSSVPEFLQKFLQQSAKKIPGATKLLQPDIDMWGREKTYGDLPERLVENFVSPGYYEKIDPTELDSEIERLYEETGNNEAIPAEAAKKFTVDKKDIYLTAEEYTEYARTMGQKRYELALECIRSDEYKKADAAGKVKLLKKAYDKGRDYAKEKILEKREKAE